MGRVAVAVDGAEVEVLLLRSAVGRVADETAAEVDDASALSEDSRRGAVDAEVAVVLRAELRWGADAAVVAVDDAVVLPVATVSVLRFFLGRLDSSLLQRFRSPPRGVLSVGGSLAAAVLLPPDAAAGWIRAFSPARVDLSVGGSFEAAAAPVLPDGAGGWIRGFSRARLAIALFA